MFRKNKIIILVVVLLGCIFVGVYSIYKWDKSKYEPKLWIGMFDYRLNFRDVGQSLNQCLNKEVFNTGLMYRSNKYFSGWSCDKIQNPQKIYSLNFSPWDPHSYYCEKPDGTRMYGYHPNTTFEISDIEKLENWKRPEFKQSMCVFFKNTIQDLIEKNSFLFHCDVGRDRTGTFAAMMSLIMLEQKKLSNAEMINAIECDYEKTSALEKHKIGRMKNFMEEMQSHGGISKFIEGECHIPFETLSLAASQFIK
ncbi:tyrosine-protein phosphatase [Silvanigrella aquatica]|uniref:Tyrosine specific protein phosphatases domain-containing protein n=1 Tax=Silvanigrella aquatica TaxID=1915309 RepID=A0A1L4D3K9_9BACT|nr:tyrosine-protein phosphatase [Silvanigrella aquatica]APJ04805.1 hypothetical protein AXG55_13210 [Silvanigrella aquatica]